MVTYTGGAEQTLDHYALTTNDARPDITRLANGDMVVTWLREESNDIYHFSPAIAAQLLDPDGNPIGSSFLVAAPNNDISPSVAALAGGGFAVARANELYSNPSLTVQLYDADGTAQGAAIHLGANPAGIGSYQWAPQIVGMPDGGFFVAWNANNGPTHSTSGEVIGQFFNADGTAKGNAFAAGGTIAAIATPGSLQASSGLAATLLDNGNLAVAWVDNNILDARIIDQTGAVVKSDFAIGSSSSSNYMNEPELTTLAGGGFVATWDADRIIHAQVYADNGTAIGSAIPVATNSFGNAVTALQNGGFVVSWYETASASSPTGADVYAQTYDASGHAVGTPQIINATLAGNQGLSTVIGNDAGDFTAYWLTLNTTDSLNGRHFTSDAALTAPASQMLSITPAATDPIAIGASSSAGTLHYAVSSTAAPHFGDVAFDQADGTFVYTPHTGALGDDQFDIAITDGTGNTVYEDIFLKIAAMGTLTGTSGADTLNEAGVYKTLVGGDGNDTYIIDHPGVSIVEWNHGGAGGRDQVLSSIDFALPDNVENLTLTGHAAINGEGTEGANSMLGNDADNVLYGYGGTDHLVGGAGNDTLYGGEDNDRLEGDAGNDVLDGGGGADLMDGGDGNDTYYVDNPGDQIIEWYHGGLGGNDTVYSSVSYTLPAQVERIILTGDADLSATGNDEANTLVANNSADILTGGGGNDGYYVNAFTTVVEQPGGGIDTVHASNISYTLPDNVENLVLTSGAHGYGNSLDNVITVQGSVGSVLDGGLGADTMIGGTGNDTYYVDNVGDQLIEQANGGIDTVNSTISYTLGANFENLTLAMNGAAINGTGNALANTIIGNNANNVLTGGGGKDTLIGAGGADTFVLSGPAANGYDTITDFVSGTDKLQIHAADYGLPAATPLNAFDFEVIDHVIGPNPTFLFNPDTHILSWDPDGTGSDAAINLVYLQNASALHASDFIVT